MGLFMQKLRDCAHTPTEKKRIFVNIVISGKSFQNKVFIPHPPLNSVFLFFQINYLVA